ncbi:MAG TPA: hypothetical protein DCZ23_02185 [Lachnospiraceae bacterium]|nr:hypothetical protein [Lachnospiraceae bacterium]
MREIKKRCCAIGLSLALAVSVVWQGMPVQADEYMADEAGSGQITEKEQMDLEISRKMVNNYRDVDEEPPASVSEYKDYFPQNYALRLDEKYDPRKDEEIAASIPAIRNQSPFGTCWAHSAMAMVEMSLLKQGMLPSGEDMSEFQTVFFMNHDWPDPLGLCSGDNFHVIKQGSGSTALSPEWYTSGNNTTYTKFMLMDWVGAVSEVKEPAAKYSVLQAEKNSAHLDDSYAISKDSAHVQDVYVINSSDRDIVKQMISDYGAVGISYFDNDTYYNSKKAAYYNYESRSTNHAVAAVGWDDNFDASNFKTTPPGNGAWLIRNSWGDWYGESGYFWISYYDTSLSTSAYAVKAVSSDDKSSYYDHNYQYDGGISLASGNYSSGVEEANVFTAQGKEVLKAVAIYTNANYDYDIKIYKNLTDKSDPVSGTEVTSTSGTQLFEGYHTVELEENVSLNPGDVFSVVVTLKNNNSGYTYYAVDNDYNGSWIYSDAEAQEGQSFCRAAGSNSAWMDLGKQREANLRIKAYTINDAKNPITSIDIKEAEHTMKAGEIYNLSSDGNMDVQPSGTDDTVIYYSDNESVAKVATDGAITAVRPGDAVITAEAFAGTGKDSIKINVSLQKPAETITLSKDEITLSIGNTKKIEAVLTPEDTDDYVIWTASGSAIATVDEEGNVTGVSEGTAVVTATTISGKQADCTVNVKSRAGDTIECTFDKLPKKLYKYNTYKIALSNTMKKLSPEKIEWKTGRGTAGNIILTPVGEGGKDGCELYVQQVASSKNRGEKLRIDATVSYIKTGKKGQTPKTKIFKRPATSYNMSYNIELDKRSISFTEKKSSVTLGASFNESKPDDQPTNTKLKWMVTNSVGVKDKNGRRIISVNGKGVVKPKGPGIAYVTVFAADSYDKASKSYKVKDTIKVTCVPVTTVSFSPASLSLKKTETVNLKEKIIFNGGQEPYNKDKMKLKWSSSSKKNVSVNGKGVAKVAKKAAAGTYTIKVQATGGVPKGQTVPEATVNIVVQE